MLTATTVYMIYRQKLNSGLTTAHTATSVSIEHFEANLPPLRLVPCSMAFSISVVPLVLREQVGVSILAIPGLMVEAISLV